MSSSNIFKHKLRELLLPNYERNKNKIISRNKNLDQAIEETLINTYRRIKIDNNTLPIREINSFHCLNNIDSFTKRTKSKYDIKKIISNNTQIKAFEEMSTINNFNDIKFNNVTLKTIEYINDNRKRSLKRNKTFQVLNNEKGLFNKPPLILNDEICRVDKEYLRGISPINNFINMKKKVNEYKNEILGKKDNFYTKNLIKDKKGKIKYKKFKNKNYEYKNKFDLNNNNKKIQFRRVPSLIRFNSYRL